MSEIKVSIEVQLNGNSPATETSEESMVTLTSCVEEDEDEHGYPESSQPDEDMVDDDLAPSCVENLDCSSEEVVVTTPPHLHAISIMDVKLRPIEQQLKYLLNKADEFQTYLTHRCDHLRNESFSGAVVPMFLDFLRTQCQEYFSYLEAHARSSTLSRRTPLPEYIRSWMLDFSQQLCTRLEQLILMYAGYNVLSLDESEPDSVSHFYIGQYQVDGVSVSMFRYCQPTAYLAGLPTGLYKRMRWNVERACESQDTEAQTAEGETSPEREAAVVTEYYFLCYEVPEARTQAEGELVTTGNTKMWSIGRWVQTDPETDDICDWIHCVVPQGQYLRLLCLGEEEPSACSATDLLPGVLF